MLESNGVSGNSGRVELYNSPGEMVLSRKLNQASETIRIEVAIPGIYFLQIKGDNETKTFTLSGE